MVAKRNEAFQRVFVSTEKRAEDTWGKPPSFFSLKKQKLKMMWRRWKKQKTNMRGKEEEEVTGEKSQKTKVKKIRLREEQIKNTTESQRDVFNFILSAELLVFSSFQSALMFSLV